MKLLEQIDDNASVRVQQTSVPQQWQDLYARLKKLESFNGIQMRLPYDLKFY